MQRESPQRERQPQRRARWLGVAGLLLTSAAPVAAERDVVAEVGALAIESATLHERAGTLWGFQRRRLGASWPEQRRRLLEEVLIPRALLDQAARAPAIRDSASVKARRDQILRDALLRALWQERAAGVSDAELARYYREHLAHYERPRALEIWRLLAPDEATARSLITRLAGDDGALWRQLVREHSIDASTFMRAGSLGWVYPDGATEHPEVRVSPALFAAADGVADGELVPVPVAEGGGYAVVWRKRSRPSALEPFDAVRDSIRLAVLEARVAAEHQRLLEALRRARLTEHHPARLEGFEPPEPPLTPRPEPHVGASRPAEATPRASERGLR